MSDYLPCPNCGNTLFRSLRPHNWRNLPEDTIVTFTLECTRCEEHYIEKTRINLNTLEYENYLERVDFTRKGGE